MSNLQVRQARKASYFPGDRVHGLSLILVVILASTFTTERSLAQSRDSTRVTDPRMHAGQGRGTYSYRRKTDYVLAELDLKEGDVVVDIGAGDGWWAERFARIVGPAGRVHAGEVARDKVRRMKEKFAASPEVQPYLCPTDGTGLPENSCDLAFLSQTYHHLDSGGRVDYLRHLRSVVKPDGRVVIIEKYLDIASNARGHGTSLSQLVKDAEDAGWVPVRCELMVGTYHYLATLVQKELFPREPRRRRRGGRPRRLRL